MEHFLMLVLPQTEEAYFETELLSCSVFCHIAAAAAQAGGTAFLAGAATEEARITPADFWNRAAGQRAVLWLQPAAGLSAQTLERLVGQEAPAALTAGHTVLALWDDAEKLQALAAFDRVPEGYATVQANPGEGILVTDCESAYAVQESIRRRINLGLLQQGVMLVDPATTHVSPLAVLEPGCTVLPGCLIYGKSVVEKGAVIGPNALLRDARIGQGATINASQVNESTVGAHTTVGPFAYIRPGCVIGEHARIGDFVELKNSSVGNETKISHLTYIGDTDLGRHINVGCGVVTVNYDGKKKYRTTVEDGGFIGCNVNLVSPVHVGKGAYLAAGGTITEDVPDEAFVIARARATVKPDWVKKRRESGKL